MRQPRVLRPRTQSTRSSSNGRNDVDMYFSEVDVATKTKDAQNYKYDGF